jgi:hypothetical protein
MSADDVADGDPRARAIVEQLVRAAQALLIEQRMDKRLGPTRAPAKRRKKTR